MKTNVYHTRAQCEDTTVWCLKTMNVAACTCEESIGRKVYSLPRAYGPGSHNFLFLSPGEWSYIVVFWEWVLYIVDPELTVTCFLSHQRMPVFKFPATF